MKKVALVGAAIAVFAAWTGYSRFAPGEYGLASAAAVASPDEVMATVDGEPVTRGEVDAAIDAMLGPQLRMIPEEQRAAVRAQVASKVLEGVIEKTLLMRAVDEQGIEVEADEVAASLEQITKRLPPDKTIEDYLAGVGMSEDELENEIAEGLRVQKWLEARAGDVEEATPSEIEALYESDRERFTVSETVEARHILVAIESGDDAEAMAEKKAEAEKIRQELVNGRSFEETARAVSDCPSREQGGTLGAFAKGEIVPGLEEAAFSQEVEEIGPVVETRFGYHIIQVQKHTDEKVMTLAEVQADIAAQLRAEKQRAAIEAAIAELKKEATVTYS